MPVLRIAIPAMDELDYLPATLNALSLQNTIYPFVVYVCVNQPDVFWSLPEKNPFVKTTEHCWLFFIATHPFRFAF